MLQSLRRNLRRPPATTVTQRHRPRIPTPRAAPGKPRQRSRTLTTRAGSTYRQPSRDSHREEDGGTAPATTPVPRPSLEPADATKSSDEETRASIEFPAQGPALDIPVGQATGPGQHVAGNTLKPQTSTREGEATFTCPVCLGVFPADEATMHVPICAENLPQELVDAVEASTADLANRPSSSGHARGAPPNAGENPQPQVGCPAVGSSDVPMAADTAKEGVSSTATQEEEETPYLHPVETQGGRDLPLRGGDPICRAFPEVHLLGGRGPSPRGKTPKTSAPVADQRRTTRGESKKSCSS